MRSAFASLLALEPNFAVVDLPSAEVVVELRVVPAISDESAVVGTFAVVRPADSSQDEALIRGAFVGLHELSAMLVSAIRCVARGETAPGCEADEALNSCLDAASPGSGSRSTRASGTSAMDAGYRA